MLKYEALSGLLPMRFADLLPILRERNIFLILDRDGTVVPFSDDPASSVPTVETIEMLEKATKLLSGRVALVSARSLRNLKKDFHSCSMILAGNYGLEIAFPEGFSFLHHSARNAENLISDLRNEISQSTGALSSFKIDDHQYSLCLHFHHLPEESWNKLEKEITCLELDKRYSSLCFRRLETSYEIVPFGSWSKADALDEITNRVAPSVDNPLYIVFGDSHADESMFVWVNRKHGISFNVGHRANTNALGVVDSPSDLLSFLKNLESLISFRR